MAITYIESQSSSVNSSSTSVTFPSVGSGDLLVAIVHTIDADYTTITVPTGFAYAASHDNANRTIAQFWKKADGTEGTLNFSATGAQLRITVRRYSSTGSISVSGTANNLATSVSSVSVGPVVAAANSLCVVGGFYSSNNFSSYSDSFVNAVTTQNIAGITTADKISAGASESTTLTVDASTLRLSAVLVEYVEAAASSASITTDIPTHINLKWGTTHQLAVTHDGGTTTLDNVTLSAPTGWETVTYNGTAPNPTTTESFVEKAATDAGLGGGGYTMQSGDILAWETQAGLTIDAQTIPTVSPAATVSGSYKIWNEVGQTWTSVSTFTINDLGLNTGGTPTLNVNLSSITPSWDGKYYEAYPNGDLARTLTGTGFGTKSTTAYYDDFEERATGATGAAVGDLQVSTSTGSTIAASGAHSGSKVFRQDYSLDGFPKAYKALSGTSPNAYMSCWFKWSGTVTGATVWKFGRIGANTVYSGTSRAGESYTSVDTNTPVAYGSELVNSNGIVGFGANLTEKLTTPANNFTADTWHFYELEFYAGTADGNDCIFDARIDGVSANKWTGLSFLTAANSDLPDWILTPINGLDNAPNIVMLMDELYIDESRARLVMTDNATYASSTKYSVQVPVSWSDTAIQYTQKRGAIGVGETAYLHVFDSSGTLVHTSTGFTVTED